LFFSQPDWYVDPDQNCTLPLVKNGKLGNKYNINIPKYSWIYAHRLNEDNICTKLDGINPLPHT